MSAADDTQKRLLEAAIVEFAEHGFDGATLRDICARAEVNLNAVKYYHDDKRGLYVAAVRHAHAATKHDRPLAQTDKVPPAERLHTFIGGLLAMALSTEHDSVAHELLVLREMLNPTQATEEIVRSFIKPRFDELESILSELLPPETSSIDRRMMALSVVGQCLHYKLGRKIDQMLIPPSEYRRLTLPRLTEHICAVTLAAVEARVS